MKFTYLKLDYVTLSNMRSFMDDSAILDLIQATGAYINDGTEPELPDDSMRVFNLSFRDDLDSHKANYMNKVKRRSKRAKQPDPEK